MYADESRLTQINADGKQDFSTFARRFELDLGKDEKLCMDGECGTAESSKTLRPLRKPLRHSALKIFNFDANGLRIKHRALILQISPKIT